MSKIIFFLKKSYIYAWPDHLSYYSNIYVKA